MGRGGLCALAVAARLDDDHRLDRAAARAADMNLRASLIDFDIEQDGARPAVGGEQVEQIGEIDVELVADGKHRGEADRPLAPPNRPCRRRWRRIER